MADRQGLRLEKSRRLDPRALGFGGYRLTDQRGRVVAGAKPHAYALSLDDVEKILIPTPD